VFSHLYGSQPYSDPNQQLNVHGGMLMNNTELERMPLDDLWTLHERICQILERKFEQESRKLQYRLDELGRQFGGSPSDLPQRRPYPKVTPKFKNPQDPSQTWSGRGKQPRWIAELLAVGGQLDDFRI
jgi:DNA-binding protein H-NS